MKGVKNMIEPMETGDLPTEERPANTEESLTPATRSLRGFAAMSPERRKQITSKGGKAAHAVGLANKFTKETAREAGKLGGAKTGADRARMAEIGRLGGLARGRKPTARLTSLATMALLPLSTTPTTRKEP
jgi:general stress protein YciG